MSSDCFAHSVGVMQVRSNPESVPAFAVFLQTFFSGAPLELTACGAASCVVLSGSFQVMTPGEVLVCDGERFGSGLNTAFSVMSLHVSSSKIGWPLLCVTWQLVTSPLLLSVTRNPTAPSSCAFSARCG